MTFGVKFHPDRNVSPASSLSVLGDVLCYFFEPSTKRICIIIMCIYKYIHNIYNYIYNYIYIHIISYHIILYYIIVYYINYIFWCLLISSLSSLFFGNVIQRQVLHLPKRWKAQGLPGLPAASIRIRGFISRSTMGIYIYMIYIYIYDMIYDIYI